MEGVGGLLYKLLGQLSTLDSPIKEPVMFVLIKMGEGKVLKLFFINFSTRHQRGFKIICFKSSSSLYVEDKKKKKIHSQGWCHYKFIQIIIIIIKSYPNVSIVVFLVWTCCAVGIVHEVEPNNEN